jgi:hypothetical protein
MLSALRSLQHWVAGDAVSSSAREPSLAARPHGRSARTELRRLPAGAVVGLEVEARARITCLGGELWVTGPDTDDRILKPGQSLSVIGLRESRFVVLR